MHRSYHAVAQEASAATHSLWVGSLTTPARIGSEVVAGDLLQPGANFSSCNQASTHTVRVDAAAR